MCNVHRGCVCLLSLLRKEPVPETVYHVLPYYDLALLLPHGSVIMEVAHKEVHGTTRISAPDRQNPSRISMVFLQVPIPCVVHFRNL